MESSTLAIVLALTLVGTAGMFLVIARQLRGRTGMATFAAGLALLGLVFAVPPEVDRAASLTLGLVIDTAAVGAVLLLRRGLQRFMQRQEMTWQSWAALLLAFVVVAAAVRIFAGADARSPLLDAVLALLFGWLARETAGNARRDNPLLRLPLSLLAGVLAVLAVLSLSQLGYLLVVGADAASADGGSSFDIVVTLGALLLGPTLLWMHMVQITRQFEELSTRDPLTRLLNEHGLDEAFRRHFTRRHSEPVSLMHIDVDHFARVNEVHGEAAGDNVLRMIALTLESSLRADDFIARVGGEEFVVGCVSADIGRAAVLAERLCGGVANMVTGLGDGDGHLRCTVSIGLSRPFSDLEQWRAAWSEAEISLQAAKDAGCNCVVHPTPA